MFKNSNELLSLLYKLYDAPGAYLFLWVLEGELNGEGGLFLTQDNNFIQMVFCIPSALLPLTNRCCQLWKVI